MAHTAMTQKLILHKAEGQIFKGPMLCYICYEYGTNTSVHIT